MDREITVCLEPVFGEEQRFGALGSLHYWITTANITDDLLVLSGDNYFEFGLTHFTSAYNRKNTLVAVCDIGDKFKASQFGVVHHITTK